MSKSKTNFNTFLSECEEYEPVGTNGNRRERHQHRCASSTSSTSSASVATTNNGNNGNNGNNIFLNSSNYANANAGAAAVVDSSKLVLNDDNFPSLSSSKVNVKSETQNNKINFKNALSSSSHILLQQHHEHQKRLAAIAAASTFSNVSHALVKKESEYISNKIILSKRYSSLNETSIKSSKRKIDDDDDDDNNDDDDDDYENDGYDE